MFKKNIQKKTLKLLNNYVLDLDYSSVRFFGLKYE